MICRAEQPIFLARNSLEAQQTGLERERSSLQSFEVRQLNSPVGRAMLTPYITERFSASIGLNLLSLFSSYKYAFVLLDGMIPFPTLNYM